MCRLLDKWVLLAAQFGVLEAFLAGLLTGPLSTQPRHWLCNRWFAGHFVIDLSLTGF